MSPIRVSQVGLDEIIAHDALTDMPDTLGTNTDHDVRNDARYLTLDQTTPQDISGGQPDFLAGLRAGSTNQLSIDASGSLTTTGIGTFNSLDFPEIATPASPAADKLRIYAVEDADFTVLETITDLGVVNRIMQDSFRVARNTTGGALAKGTVVRFSGSTGNKPNIAACQSNAIATMPAVGILGTTVADNAFGEVMIVGKIVGIKTNYTNALNPTYAPVANWAEGDALYVNNSVLGGLQNSVPAFPSFSQWVATVEVVHATQGVLLVKTQAMLGLENGTNSPTWQIGTLNLAGASITDSTGAISFGDENLLTTGVVIAGTENAVAVKSVGHMEVKAGQRLYMDGA